MQSQKQKTIATHLSITSYFFCIFFADATFLMAGKGRSCSCNRGKRLNSQNLATFVNCSVARNSLLKTCRMLRVLNLKRDCIFCSRSQILDKSKKKKGSFVAAGIVQCILGCHSIIFAFIPTPTFFLIHYIARLHFVWLLLFVFLKAAVLLNSAAHVATGTTVCQNWVF